MNARMATLAMIVGIFLSHGGYAFSPRLSVLRRPMALQQSSAYVTDEPGRYNGYLSVAFTAVDKPNPTASLPTKLRTAALMSTGVPRIIHDGLYKIMRGTKVLPLSLLIPFYGVCFGLVGHAPMWAFSEFVYSLANPKERFLFESFDTQKRMLAKKNARALKMSRCYRIHPAFAGISLLTSTLLVFSNKKTSITLLLANAISCSVSAWSSEALIPTMMGNASAKRWTRHQLNISAVTAILAILLPATANLTKLFIYWNWSLLFCAGVLERIYVLCILSQFQLPDRTTYIKYYSPQFKCATLASVPLGVVTFLFLR